MTERLRRALQGRLEVRDQTRAHLGVGNKVLMRPDLEFRKRGEPVYVADIKYKLTADAAARNADYYQLLAYTTALDLPEGVLIYCLADGGVEHRSITVRHAGKVLHVKPVDLTGLARRGRRRDRGAGRLDRRPGRVVDDGSTALERIRLLHPLVTLVAWRKETDVRFAPFDRVETQSGRRGVVKTIEGRHVTVMFSDGDEFIDVDDLHLVPQTPDEALLAGELGEAEAFDLRLSALYLRHAYRFDARSGPLQRTSRTEAPPGVRGASNREQAATANAAR